jgi:hypothetical protein
MKKVILSVAAVGLVLAACKKDANVEGAPELALPLLQLSLTPLHFLKSSAATGLYMLIRCINLTERYM